MTPLRQRMLEDMGIRNLAENTQLSYLQQISVYARYFGPLARRSRPEDVRVLRRGPEITSTDVNCGS